MQRRVACRVVGVHVDAAESQQRHELLVEAAGSGHVQRSLCRVREALLELGTCACIALNYELQQGTVASASTSISLGRAAVRRAGQRSLRVRWRRRPRKLRRGAQLEHVVAQARNLLEQSAASALARGARLARLSRVQ